MVDTIVLTLKQGMFTIMEPDRFEPSARWLTDDSISLGGRGYTPSKQNPTPAELKAGIYKPRLTLTKRMNGYRNCEVTLKIELSLPKLIYGNNFDELENQDFESVVEKLVHKLKDMGVLVFSKVLESALVSSIHYSKNIPLTDGTTSHYLISKIKQANIKLSLDVNHTDFRNEGHSLKWHANSYEVTFYDKIKDLQQSKLSESRAIESDNIIQLNLFEQLQQAKPLEVFRMEVRLGMRVKIRQILKSIGLNIEPTFKNLFNSQISQTILLCYLHEMESRRPTLLDYQGSPANLLADLIMNNPKLKPRKITEFFGLKQALEKVGMREVRAMFSKCDDRTWSRLVSDLNKVRIPISTDVFRLVRTTLEEFEPLKLVDFQNKMLNNDKYN